MWGKQKKKRDEKNLKKKMPAAISRRVWCNAITARPLPPLHLALQIANVPLLTGNFHFPS